MAKKKITGFNIHGSKSRMFEGSSRLAEYKYKTKAEATTAKAGETESGQYQKRLASIEAGLLKKTGTETLDAAKDAISDARADRRKEREEDTAQKDKEKSERFAAVSQQADEANAAKETKASVTQPVIDLTNAEPRIPEKETDFEKTRRESDEKARARQLEFREQDRIYYENIEIQRLEKEASQRLADAEYYQEIEDRNREKDLEEKREDQKEWDRIEKERTDRIKKEKEADAIFYEKIAEDKRAAELKQREEDNIYFNQLAINRREEELRQRAEDEAYWAGIKGSDLDDEDKRILDAWNAGKSALNFAWLGN